MASPNPVVSMGSLPQDDRSYVAVYVVASVVPVTALVVCLRFYTRWAVVKSFGIDDWAILAATFVEDQLLVIAEAVFQCLMAQTGLGKHAWMLTEKMTLRFYQRWYVAIIIFYTGLGIVKVALLLQYRRLFAAKIQRLIDWALAIVIVWTLVIVFMCVFTCWPIPGFGDKRIPAKCLPRYQYIIQSVGNIVTDWVIFALPLPLLWNMRASLWHRLSLIMLFCLGFFTCAIGFVKIKYLPVKPSNDDLYRQVDSAAWSLGELCAAMIVACLPVLRPLFSHSYRAAVRRNIARVSPRNNRGIWRRSNGIPPEQLESGEIQRPNSLLEKKVPGVDLVPRNLRIPIEEGNPYTDSDAPIGRKKHTHQVSFVNWPSQLAAVIPVSPAPTHSNHPDKNMDITAVSVEI